MDKQEEVLDKAGLGRDVAATSRIQSLDGFMCDICCDDSTGLETFAMKCGHRFCVDCYRQYLAQKIKDEGEAARIRCPGERCNRIVDSKSLDLLVSADLRNRCVRGPVSEQYEMRLTLLPTDITISSPVRTSTTKTA